MNRIIPAFLETTAAAVILIPFIFWLHDVKIHSRKTSIVALTFALYLSAVYAMAGLPNITYLRFDPNFNFIPFRYLFSDSSSLLNILMFIPLGCYLPLLRCKFRSIPATFLFGFSMSLFIEVLQIFTLRTTDINDLMTNTLGTIIGYFLGKILLCFFPKLQLQEVTMELRTISLCVLAVMFFFQPFLSAVIRSIII